MVTYAAHARRIFSASRLKFVGGLQRPSKVCVSFQTQRLTSSSAQQTGPRHLFVCGLGEGGQLGLGASVKKAPIPTKVSCDENVASVACGKNFTTFATESGKVYSMGENDGGFVLGNASAGSNAYEPVAVDGFDGAKIVSVASGHKHTLALAEDGSVFSWGFGGSTGSGALTGVIAAIGALGHGDKESRARPTRIAAFDGLKVKQIACGGYHSAALTHDGKVFTWGLGEQGRLGHGNNDNILAPRCVEDLPPARFLACGEHFCAAVSNDGLLFTWGKNKVGELGHEGMSVFAQESLPKEIDRAEAFKGAGVAHVACGFQHMLAVTESGKVYVWGTAGFSHHTPQLLKALSPPAWPAARRVVGVFAGNAYSAAVCADGGALAWGRNKLWMDGFKWVGQTHVLGIEKASAWEVEPKPVTALEGVCDMSCGTFHTAFIAAGAAASPPPQ